MSAPYLDDGDLALYHGDAAAVLRSLPAGVAQTCVTSPPYWGLRDYGTGSWTGGDADCDHVAGRGGHLAESAASTRGGAHQVADAQTVPFKDACGRCGARRVDDQLGLEATPDAYVTRLVAVMREVWRVLRDDATLWLNLGDSYAANMGGANGYNDGRTNRGERSSCGIPYGLRPKDLVGIPWRVAFALQADGWYLRSDIIWAKPNPMPESVTDRPTKAHEYVFLLAKQPRYYYDADAIREAWTDERNGASGATVSKFAAPGAMRADGGVTQAPQVAGRNARSVWEVATQPTPEAHFATYPEALVRRCILAGSKPGDCVLDPFVGSGTTALVARKHGRRAIGIDLSEAYLEIAAKRTSQLSLLGEGAA